MYATRSVVTLPLESNPIMLRIKMELDKLNRRLCASPLLQLAYGLILDIHRIQNLMSLHEA